MHRSFALWVIKMGITVHEMKLVDDAINALLHVPLNADHFQTHLELSFIELLSQLIQWQRGS